MFVIVIDGNTVKLANCGCLIQTKVQ